MTHHCSRPRPTRWLAGALLALVTSLLAPVASAVETARDHECLRCHAMSTLAYREPDSGEIRSLALDPQRLDHSAHAELACSDCHARGYGRYPHRARLADEQLGCVECHADDPADATYRLDRIAEEFAASVHASSDHHKLRQFDCHSCHDPHAFRASQVGDDLGAIVRRDNQTCLDCHHRVTDPLRGSHAWLPQRDAHWAAVRCIDCHTPTTPQASHQILAAADSSKRCVACHSRDSRLREGLYRYRLAQDQAEHGWLTSLVRNDAYIVGMSRSPLLDALSLAILALVALVIALHGYGRYRLARRRKENDR
ncbi:hypothetical protein McPS_26480 [Marichromatium sp. PS1]|uniref:nitrate reductase n=1 Tax=Marichromatium sp. PS1 TaxID=3138932 RepID=UPI0032E7496E